MWNDEIHEKNRTHTEHGLQKRRKKYVPPVGGGYGRKYYQAKNKNDAKTEKENSSPNVPVVENAAKNTSEKDYTEPYQIGKEGKPRTSP
jgi:hypothetical protein